jgi:hypothetical protein
VKRGLLKIGIFGYVVHPHDQSKFKRIPALGTRGQRCSLRNEELLLDLVNMGCVMLNFVNAGQRDVLTTGEEVMGNSNTGRFFSACKLRFRVAHRFADLPQLPTTFLANSWPSQVIEKIEGF